VAHNKPQKNIFFYVYDNAHKNLKTLFREMKECHKDIV